MRGNDEARRQIASDRKERGLHPAKRETLSNGVRRVIYGDPEGNEIRFGGAPEKS
jgi:hypothetical protein